jgi:hypothetical protein
VIKIAITLTILVGYASLAQADSGMPQIGEKFVNARTRLHAAGWRADPASHASSGEYMGLDRLLVQSGYQEVDYCSVGQSFCTLQYVKGEACLRVQTQGEQISEMKVERWSNACRERRADEQAHVLPADVRYLAQWKSDCENFGQCHGIDAYSRAAKKKYARDPEVMRILNTYETSGEIGARTNR